jgi:hypothetical protein
MNEKEKTIKTIKDALNERITAIKKADQKTRDELARIANELDTIDEEKARAISTGDEETYINLTAKEAYLNRRRDWIANEGKNMGVSDDDIKSFLVFVKGAACQYEGTATKKAMALAKELCEILDGAEFVNNAANGAIAEWNGVAINAGVTIYDGGLIVSELTGLKAFLMRNPVWKKLAGMPSKY